MAEVCFIGAGAMATALGGGMLRAGVVSSIAACDPNPKARERFAAAIGEGCVTHASPSDALLRESRVVVLAVKPQVMPIVLRQLKGRVPAKGALVVSIAAGVKLQALQEQLGQGTRVVRVMPNTPALVGEMAGGFALGQHANEQDAECVKSMFGAIGVVEQVPEKLMDAVTGLAGSGPAFVFRFITALSDAGVHEGLPRPVATRLAAQTVLGAALMVKQGGHPGVLCDQVTSPGGTTIAGVRALNDNAFARATMAAVIAASRRSAELGRPSKSSL
ncbi:MAG: hypothetical protein MHM6MM_004473 [Cercozoa sp. M6MM]